MTDRGHIGLRELVAEQWWALVAAAVLFLAVVRPFYGVTADDAYISFRYAQNWAAGCGPVYNCGEQPVEGYTNFLWMAISAGAMSLGLKVVPTMRLLGLLMGVLALFLAVLLTRRLHRSRAAPLAVLAVLAASPFWAVNAVIGLETALAALSVLLAAGLSLRLPHGPRPWLAGAAWGLSYLVRPEAMAFAAFTGLWSVGWSLARRVGLRQLVRTNLLYGVGFVAVAGPYFFWRLLYYGDLFPNTFYAKKQALGVILPKNLALLGENWQFFVPLLAAALLALVLFRRRSQHYLVLLALCSAVIAMSVHNNFWMPGHRLYLTAVALLAVVIGGLADVGGERWPWLGPVALSCVCGVIALGHWTAFPKTLELARLHYAPDDHPAADMGRAIRQRARPGEWLAIRDAGMVPFFAGPRVKVLDMHESSLNDRFITRHGWSVGYVMRHKPRFILFASPFEKTYPLDNAICQTQGAPLEGLKAPEGERRCLVFAHLQSWLIAQSPEFRAAHYREVMMVPWHKLRYFFLFARK